MTLLGQVLDNIRKVSSLSKVSHYTWSTYCNLATVGQAYNLLWRILPHNTKQRNTYSGVFHYSQHDSTGKTISKHSCWKSPVYCWTRAALVRSGDKSPAESAGHAFLSRSDFIHSLGTLVDGAPPTPYSFKYCFWSTMRPSGRGICFAAIPSIFQPCLPTNSFIRRTLAAIGKSPGDLTYLCQSSGNSLKYC